MKIKNRFALCIGILFMYFSVDLFQLYTQVDGIISWIPYTASVLFIIGAVFITFEETGDEL